MNDMKTPEELFYENIRFSKFILKQQFPNLCLDEDMKQVADLGLWKACISYNQTSKTKFTTFAGVVIKNEICNALRSINKTDKFYCVPLSQPFIDTNDDNLTYEDMIKDPRGEEFSSYIITRDTIISICNSLSCKEKKVLQGLLQGKSSKQIVKEMNITRSNISQIRRKIKGRWLCEQNR